MMDDKRIATILTGSAQGSADELYQIGCMFAQGDLSEKGKRTYRKALCFFEQAGKKGHPKAWYELGYLYESGQAGETSPQKAFECYCKAMELGDEEGTDKVRICYQEGIGTDIDLVRAEEIKNRYK